jgi:hypothetical protein
MPLAALALKKNLCGAVAFKTCDNEDSTASLGDSKVASVQSSPRNAIPEFVHFTEESEEVTALIRTEDPWDIFKEQPARSSLLHKFKEGKGKAAALACESFLATSKAEVLAGEPA